MSEAPVLDVQGLTVFHGQLRAVSDVSLRLDAGDVYAIIGANGAGKSTLLRTLAGLHEPTEGRILLDGVDVTRMRPDRRLAAGMALVPEGRRLFPSLTVEENLLVAADATRPGPWHVEQVYELFDWMRERRRQRQAPHRRPPTRRRRSACWASCAANAVCNHSRLRRCASL